MRKPGDDPAVCGMGSRCPRGVAVSNPQLAVAVDGAALCGWLMVVYGLYPFHRHPIHLGLIVAFWAHRP